MCGAFGSPRNFFPGRIRAGAAVNVVAFCTIIRLNDDGYESRFDDSCLTLDDRLTILWPTSRPPAVIARPPFGRIED